MTFKRPFKRTEDDEIKRAIEASKKTEREEKERQEWWKNEIGDEDDLQRVIRESAESAEKEIAEKEIAATGEADRQKCWNGEREVLKEGGLLVYTKRSAKP